MVAEDDVRDVLGEVGREALDLLAQAPHAVVAQRDLALQAPGAGEIDGRRGRRGVGVELADVVQQRARDRDVVVDARERRAQQVRRLADAQRVLEQPVAVGLVVVLGRGGLAEARPQLRALAEDAVEQRAQVRLAHRADQLAQLGLHLVAALGRAVEQVVERERARGRRRDRADGDLRAVARVLREACVTFLFAPNFHPAMKHVGPVRRELGVPSVMNLVGPLANPAGARRQVLGVADPERVALMAEALARLGAEHAMVVHGRIGMDEVSPLGMTDVWEVRDGRVTHWELDPAQYGYAIADAGALAGGEPANNAARVEALLAGGGNDAAGRAAVMLNAGAAVYVAGLASTYVEGIKRAADAISRGLALRALERLRQASAGASASTSG